MKKFISILLFCCCCSVFFAQTTPARTDEEYCILHTFGPGHHSDYKGAFITYPTLMVERRQLVDNTYTGYLKMVMEAINAIRAKGFVLVSSNTVPSEASTRGEYVFKRTP